ncbi:MAG: phage baseplate upper protein [Armatimonadetes bacterium]|nr:phage baseplate upper protein [Armatimonadota bacterium]
MTYQVDFNDLPVQQPFRVMQGDTYCQPYELWLNDQPLSLMGATIRLAVRRSPAKGTLVVNRTITADDAPAGKFTVLVTGAETAQMLGEYYYEVQIDWPQGSEPFPGGCTKTIVAGPMTVREDVLH